MTPAEPSLNGPFQSMFGFSGLTNGPARLPTFLKRPVHFLLEARTPNRSIIWLQGAIIKVGATDLFLGENMNQKA